MFGDRTENNTERDTERQRGSHSSGTVMEKGAKVRAAAGEQPTTKDHVSGFYAGRGLVRNLHCAVALAMPLCGRLCVVANSPNARLVLGLDGCVVG